MSEQASDWLLRLRSEPDNPETVRQFEAWRSASRHHSAAWQRAGRTWALLGDLGPDRQSLAQAGPEEWLVSDRRPASSARFALRHTGKKRRLAGFAGLAFAACLLLYMVAPALLVRLQADQMTLPGEIRTVTLEDGSAVTLAGSSAIKTNLDGAVRSVRLLAGEAFFHVHHDSDRPFVVQTDEITISVLGTVFDVRVGTDGAEVSLLRGSVRARAESGQAREDQVLVPGDRFRLERKTGEIRTDQISLDEIGSWRHGQLFVVDASVRSVVEQIGRYHSAWIKIADPQLATRRVTGVYDLSDPDRALRALLEPLGGKVYKVAPLLRVVSRL